MSKLEQLFHEELQDAKSLYDLRKGNPRERWNGMCCFCGFKPYTELLHFMPQTKANIKMVGDIIDAPIVQVLPGCRQCNSVTYESIPKHVPYAVILAGRKAFQRYLMQKFKNK
jgi:hypothetical protein